MDMQLLYCIVYFLLFFISLKTAINKNRKCIAFILAIWTIHAFLSIFYYLNPFMQFDIKLTLWAFIYLFICVNIAISPFLIFNEDSIGKQKILCNPLIFQVLIVALAVFSVVPFIEFIYQICITGLGDLHLQYTDSDTSSVKKLSKIGSFCYSVVEYLRFIAIPLFFVYITEIKKHNNLLILGLLTAIFCPVLSNLANGERFAVMIVVFSFAFNYILFSNKLSTDLKKKIKKYAVSCCLLMTILVIAISIGRFGKNSDYDQEYGTSYQFLRYLGEASVRFNTDAIETIHHTNGSRIFVGYLSYFENYKLDIEFINRKLGFASNNFFTVLGDLVIDFGTIPTFFIVLIFTGFMFLLYKKRQANLKLGTIIFFNLYVNIWNFGICYFIYMNGFIHFIWSIIIAIIINIFTANNDKLSLTK